MFLEEQNSKQTWTLQPERVYRLGRNPDQDIRLDEPSVSRSHAELFWNGETWCVRDCGSRFGTYLGDEPIQEQHLQPEEWFRLGTKPGVMLRLQSESSPGDSELPTEEDVFYPPAPPEAPFNLEHFRGHPTVKTQLKQYADLILDADLNHPVQGILMLGTEGRGKRFLCRCLADQLGQERDHTFNFMSRDLKEAQNLYRARKLIRQWLKECTKHAPTVLLLHNFDTFYHYLQQAEQVSQSGTGQTTWWNRFWGSLGIADLKSEAEKARKLREQLDTDIETYWQWNLTEDTKILILASAKNPELLPPEVRRAGGVFSHVLQIPRPNLEGRMAVLEKYLHKTETPIARTVDLKVLAQQLGRIEGHGIEQLVKDTERYRYETGSPCLQWQHFEPFLPVASEKLWEQIFLPDPIAQRLQQLAKVLREFDLSTSQGPVPPKGLLLTGPPGTGKTAVARILAKDANCYFQAIAPSTIKSSLVGQAVKNLQALFAHARAQAPAILFFDEIDALFPRRDEQSGDPTALEIVNQFLQEADGFKSSAGVFVLGATNRPEEIDPAVRSRLQEQIAIPLPDQDQRVQMLQHFTTRREDDE
ncbi:MAG: AAA family ATPase, partial [Cyanothece sp. SIO1E1]|nr:AAA family ATPase [Cyanothece sp. SIO1E1]